MIINLKAVFSLYSSITLRLFIEETEVCENNIKKHFWQESDRNTPKAKSMRNNFEWMENGYFSIL